jgi:hypothetical protein
MTVGMVVLTTRPLGRRGSTRSLGQSARQKARPAWLSERQVCWWRCSYGQRRMPALQSPPSLLSTLHNHGSSLCGFPRSYSTEAVPEGHGIHRRGGSPHTQRTGVRICTYDACGPSAGSVCLAVVSLTPRTSPPSISDLRTG